MILEWCLLNGTNATVNNEPTSENKEMGVVFGAVLTVALLAKGLTEAAKLGAHENPEVVARSVAAAVGSLKSAGRSTLESLGNFAGWAVRVADDHIEAQGLDNVGQRR